MHDLVGSLFSGVGGFDLAFERANFKVSWQVEIDAACQRVLAHHWPNTKRVGDIRDVDASLPAVDVIVGGFPCTDVSLAGGRSGLAGEGSGLWFEFRRVLALFRPGWVVIENVPGLLSSYSTPEAPRDLQPGKTWSGEETSDFASILAGLSELGYHAAWRVLDAQYFGVPQRRRRVFIVANLAEFGGRCAQVLFEPDSLRWHSASGRGTRSFNTRQAARHSAGSVRDRVDICSSLEAAQGGPDDNTAQGNQLVVVGHDQGHSKWVEGNGTLVARDYKDGYSSGIIGTGSAVRRFTPLEAERLQGFPDGWTEICKDTDRYHQMGNAVAVPVVHWVARRLYRAMNDLPIL